MDRASGSHIDPDVEKFGCTKIGYLDKLAADNALERMWVEGTDDGMWSYQCDMCLRWHHGHPPRNLLRQAMNTVDTWQGQIEAPAQTLGTTRSWSANFAGFLSSASTQSCSYNQTSQTIQPESVPNWKAMWLQRPGGPDDPNRIR
jgi:hypothetical protein